MGIHRKLGSPPEMRAIRSGARLSAKQRSTFHQILLKHQADKFTTKEKHEFLRLQQRQR